MLARDVMTAHVVSVDPDDTILMAIRLMLQHKVSGLPVITRAGVVVGVVTEGDFLRRAETDTERRRKRWLEFLIGPGRMAEEYTDTHGRKVADVMTRQPHTVSENTPLYEVVDLMERRRIKRVPVVRDGKLVGIISRANLLHAIASLSAQERPVSLSDSAIRDQIMAEFKKETWTPLAMSNVTVHDGIVDLWGTLLDERQRRAMCVAVENVPGVKQVRDHLVWEPVASVGF